VAFVNVVVADKTLLIQAMRVFLSLSSIACLALVFITLVLLFSLTLSRRVLFILDRKSLKAARKTNSVKHGEFLDAYRDKLHSSLFVELVSDTGSSFEQIFSDWRFLLGEFRKYLSEYFPTVNQSSVKLFNSRENFRKSPTKKEMEEVFEELNTYLPFSVEDGEIPNKRRGFFSMNGVIVFIIFTLPLYLGGVILAVGSNSKNPFSDAVWINIVSLLYIGIRIYQNSILHPVKSPLD